MVISKFIKEKLKNIYKKFCFCKTYLTDKSHIKIMVMNHIIDCLLFKVYNQFLHPYIPLQITDINISL